MGIIAWIRHVHQKINRHESECALMNLDRAKYEATATSNLLAVSQIVETLKRAVEESHKLVQVEHRTIENTLGSLRTDVAVLKDKMQARR